jgi:hypothetical protein
MTPGLRGTVGPFLSTRAGLLLVGLRASQLLVSGLTVQKGNLVYHDPTAAALEIWARWDAEWYLLIAERGYHSAGSFMDRPVRYQPADATGFFPLYPLLIRLLSIFGIPAVLSGVLISNLALLAALRWLRDLVGMDHDPEVANRVVWVLLAFPTSFFLSAIYAESLMLACLLGAILEARRGRPLRAGLLGALCVLSKPIGILVLIPLIDELVIRMGGERGVRGKVRRATAALLPPLAALGGYMIYCHASFGSAIPFLLRQERWRGPSTGPWRAFLRYLESPRIHDAHHSTIDLIVALLFVAAIPLLFLSLRRSLALYATVAILLPLSSTLWSFSRFAASIFPVHVLVALATSRSDRLFGAYLAVVLPLSGLFMSLYAAWWWVG